MRKNILQRVLFFILVIGSLLLLSNCRILKKTKSEFSEKHISEVDSISKFEASEKSKSEFNQEQISTYDLSNNKISSLYKLNYQPLFDAEGKIIPLIYKHTINGRTEEIYLSGVNFEKEKSSSAEIKKEVISNKINTTYKSEITYKTYTIYKTQTNYVTKVKEKDKTIKDFGFSFWIYVIYLGCILLAVYDIVYGFKSPQSKLKSFIQRVFNGKN